MTLVEIQIKSDSRDATDWTTEVLRDALRAAGYRLPDDDRPRLHIVRPEAS